MRTSSGTGSKRYGSLSVMTFPGWRRRSQRSFPEADRQLCVLYAVRAAPNKVRKKDREALAEDPKGIHWAEEALRNLRERWETKAYALLVFLHHPKPIRRYLSTTNFLERLAEEMNRRTKMVGVFYGEGAVEKLLSLVLSQLDEAWGVRRLRGFAEIQTGSYHADQTH